MFVHDFARKFTNYINDSYALSAHSFGENSITRIGQIGTNWIKKKH
jgi:hypothetical protein